jgi:hypothetical protein
MARAARNANAPDPAAQATVPPQAVQPAVVPVAAAAANPAAAAAAAVAPSLQQTPPPIVQPVYQPPPQVQFAAQAVPAPVNAFDACLARLGLMPGAIAYFHAQGLNTKEDFISVPFSSFGDMLSQITNRHITPPGVFIPYTTHHSLKAFRAWLMYRQTRGQDTRTARFQGDDIDDWKGEVSKLTTYILELPASTAAVPFLVNINNFQAWEGLLLTYLRQCRSTRCGVPLVYVIRPHGRVDNHAFGADYADVDTDLITTATHTGPEFDVDIHWIYDKLKIIVLKDGPSTGHFNFIQQFDTSRDGRAAFLALKQQAEGPAAIKLRVQSAYTQIQTARFAGLNRKFTIYQYIGTFQKAYNALSMYGEVVSETKKANHLITVSLAPI